MEGYELAKEGHSVVARMQSADGRFKKNHVRGSWNIELLLSHGWEIVPSEVNRLLPKYLPVLKNLDGAIVKKRKRRKK